MTKVLITGAEGSLGSRLMPSLENKGCKAFALPFTPVTKDIEFLKTQNIENIVHCIAILGKGDETADDVIEGNINIMAKIIALAKELKIKRFYYTNTADDKSVSAYALAKYHALEWLKLLWDGPVFNFRIMPLYNPASVTQRQFVETVIHKCIENIDIPLTSCIQRVDFTHIDDCADAITAVVSQSQNIEGRFFDTIEIGTGNAPVVADVAEFIKARTNSKSRLLYGAIPRKPQDPDILVADISKLLNSYSFKARYGWQEGIKQFIDRVVKTSSLKR